MSTKKKVSDNKKTEFYYAVDTGSSVAAAAKKAGISPGYSYKLNKSRNLKSFPKWTAELETSFNAFEPKQVEAPVASPTVMLHMLADMLAPMVAQRIRVSA